MTEPATIIKITGTSSPTHFGAVIFTHNDSSTTTYSDIFDAQNAETSVEYMMIVGAFSTSKKGSIEFQGSNDLATWTVIDSVSKTTATSQMSATDSKTGSAGGYRYYRLCHKPNSISSSSCFGVIAFPNRI